MATDNLYNDISIFDAEYYLANNPLLAAALEEAGVSAQEHYYLHGAAESAEGGVDGEFRLPNAWFDIDFYRTTKPGLEDVPANELLAHFALHGSKELLAPNPAYADENGKLKVAELAAYLEANPGVKEAVAEMTGTPVGAELTPEQASIAAFHFFTYGIEEGLSGGIADIKPVNPIEPDETDTLTEALEALVVAEAGVSDVLASAAEAVNAAEETPLKGDALKEFIKNYDAEKLAEDVAGAKEAVDDAQAKLDTTIADRSDARIETFTDNGGATELIAENIVSADARMTDANIAAAVTKAQQGVNKDPETYDEAGSAWVEGTSTGEKFTAKALQTAMINANSALAGDIITNGDDEALLVNLRTAITEYANAGGDLETALSDTTNYASLTVLLSAINTALSDADPATAAKDLVEKLVEGDSGTNIALTLDVTTSVDAAAEKAINDALAQSFDRAELYDAADAAEKAFAETDSGKLLVEAEDLAAEREALNDAVTEAQKDLQEAQELSDAMDGFKAAYDGAVAELEEAQQYFIDNDLALPVVLDGLMTATEGNDIFLYNSEAATVNGFGLEGEDTIFFGEGFTLFDATGLDITKSGIGNADVLEIIWQQVGNNVELYVEAQAFSGSVTGTDELTKVTLVGVNGSDLQDNLDNGQLSLGDLLA